MPNHPRSSISVGPAHSTAGHVSLGRTLRRLLTLLANLGAATAEFLAYLLKKSAQMVRRWTRNLVARELVQAHPKLTADRGRPQYIFLLTRRGWREAGHPHKYVSAPEHAAGVASFRVELERLRQKFPSLRVTEFFSPQHAVGSAMGKAAVIPDGAVSLGDSASDRFTLLFLEWDRDTESLFRKGTGSSIAGKLSAYEEYHTTAQWRAWCTVFQRQFRGFRVLFVASTAKRATAISALAKTTDWVWVTDETALETNGLGGFIWTHAGKPGRASILGSLAQKGSQ